MPKRALKPCGYHGCAGVTEGRYCEAHRGAGVEGRPNSAKRGYGRQHRKRRARYLAEHPLCVHCEREGIVAAATELDHVVPLRRGGADDESNWQGLCHTHHSIKTAREDGGFGR